MMIFVYISSTFGVVELKTRFESSISRNEINGGYSFHLELICVTFSTYKL
jgi:hypothetical protein